VANRVAAQTIDHASHRRVCGFTKVGAAKIDLARQAIPTPGNEGKIVRSENDYAMESLVRLQVARNEMLVVPLSSTGKTQCQQMRKIGR
jgi:hypothetical protein